MTDQNDLTRKPASARPEEDPLEELARIVSGDLGDITKSRNVAENRMDRVDDPGEDHFAADLEAELEREIIGGDVEEAEEFEAEEDLIASDQGDEIYSDLADSLEESVPIEAEADAEMSLEDQLMAELENRAARHQEFQRETQDTGADTDALESAMAEEDPFPGPEPRLQELEDELEALAGTFGHHEGKANGLDFDNEVSHNDPYAHQLDANLRSVAADEAIARAERDNAADFATDVSPAIEDEPDEFFQDLKGAGSATPERNYQRANLDLSDAFRAELEQIEQTTSKLKVAEPDEEADLPPPAEIDRSDAFAIAFEQELENDNVDFADRLSRPAAEERQWADFDEQPGPPPVMRHARGEDVPAEAEDLVDYSDEAYPGETEDQPETDEIEEFESRPFYRRGGAGKTLAAAAILVALLAGGGAIAYGYFFDRAGTSGEPPIIRADTDPVKVKPDDPGGATIDNQDKAAYEQVTGEFSKETAQEQLVTTAEEPVDVAALAREAASETGEDVELSAGDLEEPLVFDSKQENRAGDAAGDTGERSPLAPRTVRTVAVKPDGTIVPPEETPLAVTRVSETAVEDDGTIDGARSTGQIAVPVPRPDLTSSAVTESVSGEEETQSLGSLVSSASVSAGEQAAALTNAAQQVGSDGAWAVQVASRRSAEDAQQTFQAMRRDFPAIFQDKEMAVQRAEIEGRGTFYRVRVMADTRDEAVDLCTRLKSAGGSCFVTR